MPRVHPQIHATRYVLASRIKHMGGQQFNTTTMDRRKVANTPMLLRVQSVVRELSGLGVGRIEHTEDGTLAVQLSIGVGQIQSHVVTRH